MNIQDTPAEAFASLPAELGALFAGGFYAGRIAIDGITYGLVVSPKEAGEREDTQWSASRSRVGGATSYNDGMLNTVAMAEAGSELAQWARDLAIDGFTDWYIPSQDELEIIYRNLKPTTDTNSQYGRSGVNVSAVPPTQAYSLELPQQVTAVAFIEGGEQAFADEWYWTSTQHASGDSYAWTQNVDTGYQSHYIKSAELRARAVRRFVI